jgi:hypothetical protein
LLDKEEMDNREDEMEKEYDKIVKRQKEVEAEKLKADEKEKKSKK